MGHRPEGRGRRRGASLVAAALLLTALLVLTFRATDLRLGSLCAIMMSRAAREGVRQAMVNGQYAPVPWLPRTWTASSLGQPVVDAISPQLVGCDSTQTTTSLSWVDGTNEIEKQVRVTIHTTYQPFMTSIF